MYFYKGASHRRAGFPRQPFRQQIAGNKKEKVNADCPTPAKAMLDSPITHIA